MSSVQCPVSSVHSVYAACPVSTLSTGIAHTEDLEAALHWELEKAGRTYVTAYSLVSIDIINVLNLIFLK